MKIPYLSFLLLALQDLLQLLLLLLGEGLLLRDRWQRGFILLGFAGWEDQGVALIYTFQYGPI